MKKNSNLKQNIIQEELYSVLLEEGFLDTIGSYLGLGGEKKPEEDKKEATPSSPTPTQKSVGKNALIYGHSQSGGMGLDFVRLLKRQGYNVNRVTKVGWGDSQLGSSIPSETGDPSQYEKIFYFAGANRPAPQGTITANVNKLGGPSKVTVILAPYNAAKEPPNILSDTNTKGYRNEQELKSAGIKVYRPLFPPEVFEPDTIHVKPGTSIGMKFAEDVISAKSNKFSTPGMVKFDPKNFFEDIKNAISSSDVYKTVKGFFTSKLRGKLDSSEGLMKFKAHLNNEQDKIADIIYQEFVSSGFSPSIALAAIINAYKESGLNPNAIGDRGHSVGLFQLHDRGGGSGMTVEERKDPVINTKKIISIAKGSFGKKLRAADEQGKSVPVLAAIFSRDIERPANKEGNMVSRANLASDWLGIDKVVDYNNIGDIDSALAESENKKGKDDRCVRIAKSKYDAWPSAYASGAVVKCRQGKIWKNIKEEEELEEEWSDKYKKSINCKNPKGFSQRAHCQGRKKNESNDPKEGTGKKPKGSGRRLYTDENPKDTVSVKFSTAEDIRDTLSKESFKSKSHARQSQIINLIHQRVRAAHENAKDPETKARLRIALDYAEKRKEASKKKTASLQKEEVLTEKCWPGYTQKGMKTMFGKKYPNCVKKTNEEIELEEERKLSKPSSETSLRDWFKRKGAPGKRGGWVDCNTCRNGKCSPCGRQGGEKRSKYPRCRPTPAQCKGYKRRGDNLQREEEQ